MSEFLNQAYQNLLATGWLEFIAVFFGIASVWFARKENIWVYPTGIINVLIYVYLCFYAGLYADMSINAFYFVMSVVGWYNWAKKDENKKHIPITKLKLNGWILHISLIAAFYLLIRWILIDFTNSTVPDFDAFTTSLFISGMLLMAWKKLENWLAWILGDLLVIPLFAYKGLAFTSVQYIVFLALAIMGYFEWRRIIKANREI